MSSGVFQGQMTARFQFFFICFPLSLATFSRSVCGAWCGGNRSCPFSLAVPTSHNPGLLHMCQRFKAIVSDLQSSYWFCSGMSYRWFARYVMAAMLVDKNDRYFVNLFCSCTSNCTFHHCYRCVMRLVRNHL